MVFLADGDMSGGEPCICPYAAASWPHQTADAVASSPIAPYHNMGVSYSYDMSCPAGGAVIVLQDPQDMVANQHCLKACVRL